MYKSHKNNVRSQKNLCYLIRLSIRYPYTYSKIRYVRAKNHSFDCKKKKKQKVEEHEENKTKVMTTRCRRFVCKWGEGEKSDFFFRGG